MTSLEVVKGHGTQNDFVLVPDLDNRFADLLDPSTVAALCDRRSGVGARVSLAALPRSAVLAAQPPAMQAECLLRGGDDYELLFTAPPQLGEAVHAAAAASGTAVTCIGHIERDAGVRLLGASGEVLARRFASFDHFA